MLRKELSDCQTQQLSLIPEYVNTIKYVSGSDNTVAFSRIDTINTPGTEISFSAFRNDQDENSGLVKVSHNNYPALTLFDNVDTYVD